MSWFLIALSAPFLWALVNISDQYLVSRYYTKERGSGGLVIFSSLIGVFIAIFIFIFTNGLFKVPIVDILLLLLTGFLTIIWVIFYLYSLEIEDVSKVIPWFLTVPIFGYILGYFFLNETLTFNQQVGSAVIIIGVALISINFDTASKKYKFKKKLAIYMIIACVLLAIIGVIFKYVTIEGSFWASSFWQYVGLGITGILLYLLVPSYRKEFNDMNSKGGKKILLLNISSEIISIIGNLLTNYAILLAPVTLVYLVGSFQPAIVLILTLISTHFYPHIVKEDISKKILLQKVIAILIMTIGSIFLFI